SETAWDAADALALPTIGTTFTVAEALADPIGSSMTLGHYTNFVNLLDLCGVAVPAATRPDSVPFGSPSSPPPTLPAGPPPWPWRSPVTPFLRSLGSVLMARRTVGCHHPV